MLKYLHGSRPDQQASCRYMMRGRSSANMDRGAGKHTAMVILTVTEYACK